MADSVRRVGLVIKDLRRKLGVTGEELGRRAGLSQSKISKIETGSYPVLQYEEIHKILNILKAPSAIRQQLLSLGNDRGQTNARLAFYGARQGPKAAESEKRARSIKIYTAHAIPALLQTVEYRTASLIAKGYSEQETNEVIKQTLKRQDRLWEPGPTFHFVIPETALYTFAGSKKTQLAQLDRLERSLGIASVRLGIIPLEAGLLLAENGTFALHDKRIVFQGLVHDEIASEDTDWIVLHHRIFDSLSSLADYGNDAITLIRKATDYFS